ncbi:hypothetical protein GCK32_006958 [Trichostrongylus colubriformis]|uniref:Uncharacterized protein n=1 Tax=Trichostrongylus colubriformis TaxID=6319 RepID=A0AAN8FSD4_TRICO
MQSRSSFLHIKDNKHPIITGQVAVINERQTTEAKTTIGFTLTVQLSARELVITASVKNNSCQEMNRLVMCLFVAIAFVDVAMSVTCNLMDCHPILARTACVASCKAMNCATGYCENRGGRKTCVCSRCDVGPLSL